MRGVRLLLSGLVAVVLVTDTAHGQVLPDQAITWADFSYVNSVAASNEKVYFATTNGVVAYDKLRETWDDPIVGQPGLPLTEVPSQIWIDRFGQKVYVRTDLGYYEYNPFFRQWYPIADLPEVDIAYRRVDVPDNLIPPPGSDYLGRGRFSDLAGRQWTISSVIDDLGGQLWFGSWGYGPGTAYTGGPELELLPVGLVQSRVDAIWPEPTGDRFWIGGANIGQSRTGMTEFDRERNTVRHWESGVSLGFPDASIYDIAGFKRWRYLATDDGLYIFDSQTGQVERRLDERSGLGNREAVSVAATEDTVVVGTTAGVTLFHAAFDSVTVISPSRFRDVAVWDVEILDDAIWMATDIGVYRLDRINGELAEFADPTGTIFSRADAIAFADPFLWIASDQGMIRIDTERGQVNRFSDILASREIRVLAASDDVVALSSSRGVTIRYEDTNREDRRLVEREITVLEGLPSDLIFALHVDGDYLWIGSDRGLTRFLWNNPERLD